MRSQPGDSTTSRAIPPSSTRSILITGTSSGIGLDAAQTLARLGWSVLATHRGQVPEDLFSAGVLPVELDLQLDEHAISRAVSRAMKFHDAPLDAVFLNAGFAIAGALEDIPLEAWQVQFQVNLFSQVELVNQLLRARMITRGSRIIWCGSVLGIAPMPMRGAYAASKAAMEAVADVQRLELEHFGIQVSLIQPGPILSRFRANSLAALQYWINLEASRYLPAYGATIARLSKAGAASPGTLGPQAVTRALLEALQARQMKSRYRVTRNTGVMHLANRLLPRALVQALLRQTAGHELMPAQPQAQAQAEMRLAPRADATELATPVAWPVVRPTAPQRLAAAARNGAAP